MNTHSHALPFSRGICLLLVVAMLSGSLLGLVSCANSDSGTGTQAATSAATDPDQTSPSGSPSDTSTLPSTGEPTTNGEGQTVVDSQPESTPESSPETEPETETESDPFANVNYNDRPFRILTSTNAASAGMGNSNYLIEGEKLASPTVLNDAVMARNAVVEEKLGVKLEFTQESLWHPNVATHFRNLASSGLDEFDLVINDLYPFANLSIEGCFQNVYDPSFTGFDFENKSYWYKEYMDDLCLVEGYQFMLAGDYFIDILRSAHLLLFNKSMYDKSHGDGSSNAVYEWVLNYEWTYEKFLEMLTDTYADLNNNGTKDYGDRFGFSVIMLQGSVIGFSVSAAPTFVIRDETGAPVISLDEDDRAADLTDWMTKIYNHECSSLGFTKDANILSDFTNRLSLICDYQRLGSLENEILNNMQDEPGVLPYPMLYASDKQYNTATHDTTELGAILKTSPAANREFISTVIQVLNRETANILMPKYYVEALQIRYVTDPYASKMVQIIHDNIRHSFSLAYNSQLGNAMLQVFTDAIDKERPFANVYKGIKRSSSTKLKNMIKNFKKANQIT